MQEPTHKKKNERWTVEAGGYDAYQVLGTFDHRGDARKFRDDYNKNPKLYVGDRAYIGTIVHNPTN